MKDTTEEDFAVALLAEGLGTDEVLAAIHRNFPGTRADRDRVAGYRWRARTRGLLPSYQGTDLERDAVAAVRRVYWLGRVGVGERLTQREVARTFEISQSYAQLILTGARFPEYPGPTCEEDVRGAA